MLKKSFLIYKKKWFLNYEKKGFYPKKKKKFLGSQQPHIKQSISFNISLFVKRKRTFKI